MVDASGVGIADVTVVARTAKGDVGNATTDPIGAFSIYDLKPGNYVVSPLLIGYLFTPPAKTITVTTSDISGVTFRGKPDPKACRIYGYVMDKWGKPVSGAQVSFTGNLRSVRTNALGYYEGVGATDGTTYTVSATARNLLFLPPSANVTITGASRRLDFRSPGSTAPGVTLQCIVIQGPGWVNGGGGADYTCTAKYSDNTTQPIAPFWTVNSPVASINELGTLTTTAVGRNTRCTVVANHSEDGVSRSAQFGVTVMPVGSGGAAARVACIEAKDNDHPGRFSTTKLQMVSTVFPSRIPRSATLSAQKLAEDAALPWGNGEPRWSGPGVNGLSGESVTWPGISNSRLSVSAGGNTRKAEIELIPLDRDTLKLNTKEITNIVEMLQKVARYTGSTETCHFDCEVAILKTEMVDMYNDPRCARKYVAAIKGIAKLEKKLAPPGWHWKFWDIAEFGPYLKPSAMLKVGIDEAGMDPSQQHSWVAKGVVTLKGSVALGMEVKLLPKSKDFRVDVYGEGSAGVSGNFEFTPFLAPQEITAQVTIGDLDFTAEATVIFWGREIFTWSHLCHLWDGVKIPPSEPAVIVKFASFAPKN